MPKLVILLVHGRTDSGALSAMHCRLSRLMSRLVATMRQAKKRAQPPDHSGSAKRRDKNSLHGKRLRR